MAKAVAGAKPRVLTLFALGWLCASVAAARAQTPNFQVVIAPPHVETVIVTAPKWLGDQPKTVIHNFVQSFVMAAPVSDEISRWKNGICPATHGLSLAEYDDYVTQRMRQLAHEVGAPVQTASCRHNIDVVFTDKPQEFLDRVKKEGSALLGPQPSRAERIGTMRFAIQAWYATGTRDINGLLLFDDQEDTFGGGLRGLPERAIQGSLLGTGLRSELFHIFIVADTSKTKDFLLGAIADYVAVLALTQTQSFQACKSIPSITNLVSPGCAAELKPTAITDTDMAFLKAVYSMNPGANLVLQQSYITDEIAKSLGVK